MKNTEIAVGQILGLTRRPRALLTAVALVLLLILVALTSCSASGDGENADTATFELLDFTKEQYFNERVDLFDLSPLVVALGVAQEDSRAFALATMLRIEDLTERCMAERGLLYYPHVVRDDLSNTWLPAMSRIDFARTHGFGSALQPDEGLTDVLVLNDPNDAHLATLDADERREWERALYDNDSCRMQANDSIWGPQTAVLTALQDQSDREVSSHVDVRRAADDYVVCMRDAGYPWLNNPWNSRHIGVETARTGVVGALQSSESTDRQGLSLEEERDAAVANLECLYPADLVRRSVRNDVESRIVDDNAELLASLRRDIASR